jgi:hypothetical protein
MIIREIMRDVQESRKESQRVAATILAQMGGAKRLQVMIGANSFASDRNGVLFKFRGTRKANAVRIELTPQDLYRVEFYKQRGKAQGYRVDLVHELDEVYCDMLIELFEQFTGLYLTI